MSLYLYFNAAISLFSFVGFIYGIITQILLKILGYNIYFPVLLIFSFYITLVYYNLYAQFALNGAYYILSEMKKAETGEDD